MRLCASLVILLGGSGGRAGEFAAAPAGAGPGSSGAFAVLPFLEGVQGALVAHDHEAG